MKSLFSLLLNLSLAIIIAITGLFSANGLQAVLNAVLPASMKIVLQENLYIRDRTLALPSFRLFSQQAESCELLTLHQTELSWQKRLSVQQLQLDYACLQAMTTNQQATQKTPVNLTALLALIPESEIDLPSVKIINTESIQQPYLQQLLQADLQLNAQYKNQRLMLTGKIKDKSAVIFSLNSYVENQIFTGNIDYQPKQNQHHKINFNLSLQENLLQIPKQSQIYYQWKDNAYALTEGTLEIQWQANTGKIILQDDILKQERLNIPFQIQGNQLNIQQAKFNWDIANAQPLKGILNLSIRPQHADFLQQSFPFHTDFRISLFSEGSMGKGNVVIQTENALVSQEKLHIPLRATGNFKYQNMIAYSQLPMLLNGNLENPTLNFLPTSLLRITGKKNSLDIEEIRLPLAGVTISRYGLKGRLQAILKANSPQFTKIKLHLDGQANQFIAGIKSIFSIRAPTLAQREKQLENSWHWQYWGQAYSTALKSNLHTSGKGSWVGDTITINKFNGEMKKVALSGVSAQKLNLSVTEPLVWQYEKKKLTGQLNIISPEFLLGYGGRFIRPKLKVALAGQDLNHFNLEGILTAGKLGPIKIFARYFERNMVGNVYWLEQSARVFQPLFPFRWNWVIKQGTIRGQTAFSVTPEKGFIAGGHFAIRAGDLLLPNGRVEGIEFSLPYQFKNNHTELGLKTPIEVYIQQITNGNLQLSNIRSKVRGYYPYNQKQPLYLTELNMQLLGGELSINKFALPQTDIANVKLTQIELAEVISLLRQEEQLSMIGRVNGIFPFWLEGKDCIVCQGELRATSPVLLKLSSQLTDELKKGGITENILIDVLRELNLQQFKANINLATSGWVTLQARIQGYNPQKKTHNPIILNYNHKENLFDLWKSLDYGSNLEQNIEHHLYEKLDRQYEKLF